MAAAYFGASDAAHPNFQRAANWVDVLFATYNGVAALSALILIPFLIRRIGVARTYAIGLAAGAAGFMSMPVLPGPNWLLLSEMGVGVAWSVILALPYAMLASTLPRAKLGVYMGLFNVFIVLPQLVVATVMGSVVRVFFADNPIGTLWLAAVALLIAAGVVLVGLLPPANGGGGQRARFGAAPR